MEGHKLIRHLFLSDFQIPDHNPKALQLIYKFIPDFKPDYLHLLGDLLNLSYASKYPQTDDTPTLGEEITTARQVIYELVEKVRQINPAVEITWFCGNHELRLEKYLYRQADRLPNITDDDGEKMLTIPHIFHLKSIGVNWVPYYETHEYHGISLEHGDKIRAKAGYTAQAMIDSRGRSGVSGHSHRLGLVARNQGGDVRWWMETGCLCNLSPTPNYVRRPDWELGLGVGIYDAEENIMHPVPILIQKDSFCYAEKIYDTKESPEETPEGNHPK